MLYTSDVRVNLNDGTREEFRGLWVSPDSLGGWLVEPAGSEKSFPLVAVASVEVRRARRPAKGPPPALWGFLIGATVGGTVGGVLGQTDNDTGTAIGYGIAGAFVLGMIGLFIGAGVGGP